MKNAIHLSSNIEFKTDGESVWWWSSNLETWFPDEKVTPEDLDQMIETGKALLK